MGDPAGDFMDREENATALVKRERERWPLPDEALTEVPCPVCEGPRSRTLLHGCDRMFGRPGYYPVVQCEDCGMTYVNPRPTFEALGRHYPDNYFPVRLPDTKSPMLELFSRVLFAMRWEGYIKTAEKIIGRIPAEAKVVDVGCGLNHLLVRLEQLRGCRGLGIELKPETVAYIKERQGMPVSAGTLEDAHLDAGSVDLVTMNEYLEHEPEPLRVLREARRISKKGAYLIVEVPYIGGLTARVFGSRWSQLDVPRHLAFFTPDTLKDILQRSGYRLVQAKPFGVPFSIGGSVLNTLGFKNLGEATMLDVFLIGLAGMPFLLLSPWLHEFLFVVAQAD
jgi:SAM-dependent methyltransferase